MVRLDRIYTKSGDDGTTSLGDGARVEKHHPRVAAYGTADELSAVLGLSIAHGLPEPWRARLSKVQNELLDIGADLCVPGAPGHEAKRERLRVTEAYTKRLEDWIDEANAPLEPLKSFVLPGGTPHAAWMHLARNVCRRGERHVTELMALPAEKERVNPEVLRYLNRLSDLLFVLGRFMNDRGRRDVLWVPGRNAS